MFLFVLVTARHLSLSDFGHLLFALAYAHIAFIFIDLGVSTALWREAATAKDGGWHDYLNAHRLRPFTVIFGLAVALGGLFIFDLPPEGRGLVILVCLGTAIEAHVQLDQAVFKAREQISQDALVSVFGRGAFVVLALILLWAKCGLTGVGIAYLFGQIVALVISRRAISFPNKHLENETKATDLLKQALPLAAVGFFTVVYFRIDLVMLEGMAGPEQAGLYGSAYRMIGAAMLLPAAFLTAIFPQMARDAQAEQTAESVNNSLKMLGQVAIAGVAYGLVFAPEIMTIVFGESFRPAANALRVLLVALWCIYLNYLLTHLLIVHRKQGSYARIVGLCALLNIALNAALIPMFALYGAAIATVLTEGMLLALSWRKLAGTDVSLALQNLFIPLNYGAILLILFSIGKWLSVPWAMGIGLVLACSYAGGAVWTFHRRELI